QSAWNKRLITGSPKEDATGMNTLAEMLEAGQIKPVIDRTYSLTETADAHRYVETHRKRGSVVIKVV
ncbi:MAG: zinc-binding dehydrogenase, partial [Chloroflexota bacterium]